MTMTKKRILPFLLLLALLLTTPYEALAVAATRAVISQTSASIDLSEGSTLRLTAKVYPSGADQSVVWKSGNTGIATVSNGLVTAKRAGVVKIGVRPEGVKRWSLCTVTIKKSTSTSASMTLSHTALNLGVGQSETVRATLLPSTLNQSVTWRSSNTRVAAVSAAGIVTGKSAGTALIRATSVAKPGLYKQLRVTVGDVVAPTRLTLSPADTTMNVEDQLTLTVTAYPSNASTSVVWLSSNERVLRVSNGVVHAVSAGTATIRARSTANSRVYVDRKIQVTDVNRPTSVSIQETDCYLALGETLTLHADVLPSGASQSVAWSSSNNAVAAVTQSGEVTARSAGKATITVKTAVGGLTDNLEVTVLDDKRVTVLPDQTTAISGIAINLQKIDAIRQSAYAELESLVQRGSISSSERGQRKGALVNAFAMARFPWVTNTPVRYWNNQGRYYRAGVVYYGTPYTQNKRNYNTARLLDERVYVKNGTYYQAAMMPDLMYAGNDCSSFVSMSLFGVGTSNSYLNSSAIYTSSAYKTVSFSDLRPGDIMVRNGHVAMFLYYTTSSRDQIMLIEQGGGSEPNTVMCRIRSLSYYSSGSYIARRKATYSA